MLRHLAPIIIPETVGNPPVQNAAYKVVEELVSAINDPNIKNVAVSADYGAGKSSVVETAKAKIVKDEDIRWWRFKRKKRQSRFLTISLAQLNANSRSLKTSKVQNKVNNKNKKEENKDIEYSLLQQLLYYDLPSKTPKSRFYRLGQTSICRALAWACCILLAAISYLILFEPERFMVKSFCNRFSVSAESKFWIDCVAAIILTVLFVLLCVWFVRRARIKIGKVKVKEAEVEIDTLSVFNQYLDEIIYFFASTRYNVVVFEDLDRFSDTTRIFGKLRELNTILNSSQYLRGIIKREITFVYSVRDDIFDATRRVKFFDYIVPVIPVVNSSNAYEKLCEFLEDEDLKALDGKDLLNLCEFFEELRLIINIVNEYNLYKKVIRLDDLKLSRKILFGLIVYKNYCPHDFVHLHNRRGVLASILDDKSGITEFVIKAREQRKIAAEEKLNSLLKDSNDWEKALRKEYVEASKKQTGYRSSYFESYQLHNGVRVSFERVAEDATLFEELLGDRISFYGNGQLFSIYHFADWQKAVSSKSYQERLRDNPYTKQVTSQKEVLEGVQLLNLTTADLFSKILSEEIDVLDGYLDKEPIEGHPFIPAERHKLLRFLLTHGFLDEHYLDYITYFYQNSISIEDKRFILNITSLDKECLPFTYHILNPLAVANRFDLDDYKTNVRLLNVDLALALAGEGEKQVDNRKAMQLLAKRTKAIDFILAVYESENESVEAVRTFMTELLTYWDFGALIQSLEDKVDSRLPKLREINLRYSNLNDPEMFNGDFQTWLNGHFGFITTVFDNIGEERLRAFIGVYKPSFSKISLSSVPSSFADYIIDEGYFSINSSNMEDISSYLGIQDDYKKAGFTTLYNINRQSLSSLLKQQPQEFVKVFSSTSVEEAEWAKSIIVADGRISPSSRKEYLRKQSEKIQKASSIIESALDFAFKNSLILPLWENLYYLCYEMHHAVPVVFLKNNTLVEFLKLKPEQQNEVVSKWVFANELPFSVYEKVVRTMYGFKKLEEGVELRRIDVLVTNGLLLFNASNYAVMKESYPSLAAKFIAFNLKTYLGDVEDYVVSSLEMSKILKSLGSNDKKANYLSSYPVFEGTLSADIANEICRMIQSRNLKVESIEDNLLLQAIKYSTNDDARLYVARKALFDLPYESGRCSGILNAMGGEYSRICEPGSYSWLVMNANNNRIAKYLKDNSFVKDYERFEEKIRIIK